MLKFFRTYRLLRFVAAATLVLSVTLPLVQYACAMNGMSMTGMSGMFTDCAGQEAGVDEDVCQGLASVLCPEDAPCPSAERCTAHVGDEPSCCTDETIHAEKTSVVEHKLTLAQIVWPVVAFLTAPEAVSTRSSCPSLAHELHGDAGGGVPLRVLHASFLL